MRQRNDWKTLNDMFARLNVWGDNTNFVEGINRADAERQYDAAVRWLEPVRPNAGCPGCQWCKPTYGRPIPEYVRFDGKSA